MRSKELTELLGRRPAAFIRLGILFPLGMITVVLVASTYCIQVNKNVRIPVEVSSEGGRIWVDPVPGTELKARMREWISGREVVLVAPDNQVPADSLQGMNKQVMRGRLELEGGRMRLTGDQLSAGLEKIPGGVEKKLKRLITFEYPVRISFTRELLLSL